MQPSQLYVSIITNWSIKTQRKDQAIFGLQEALIITKHLLQRDQENHLNFITFRLQVAVFILLICYTGARPGSIVSVAKVKDVEFLRWKVG